MAKTGSKPISERTDAELIRLAKKQDDAAFLEIFNRYKEGLKLHLRKLVPSGDLDDICLETFLKAFLNIERYDANKGNFRTWLYTIGWNNALDHLDKINRETEKMPVTSIDAGNAKDISAEETSPEEKVSTQEDYDKIIAAIDGLSTLYREIARLRFIEDLDYSEIAEKLDLPLNTVKTRIRRAKDMLQQSLAEEEEDELH